MIRNMIVADAAVHPYDLAPSNQITTAAQQLEAVYAAQQARAQGVPGPWSELRGAALTPPA